jgi:hypothetical protein
MTYDELYSKILEILPDASLSERDGEIVVFTNLKLNKDDECEEIGND